LPTTPRSLHDALPIYRVLLEQGGERARQPAPGRARANHDGGLRDAAAAGVAVEGLIDLLFERDAIEGEDDRVAGDGVVERDAAEDRKSTRLNSSHLGI